MTPESVSYVLLCASFQNKEKALRQAAKIRAKGYAPSVEKADLGSRGVWYRIKISGFNSKDTAEKARRELNKTLKLEAVIAKRK
jgi:cell division protein FtsN